jgi:hypothetical protein
MEGTLRFGFRTKRSNSESIRTIRRALGRPYLYSNTAINIVVDRTGLKVYGEGEWKTRTHGKSKRRTWHVYETLCRHQIDAIIPPRKNARIKQHGNSSKEPLARDVALRIKTLNRFTQPGLPQFI